MLPLRRCPKRPPLWPLLLAGAGLVCMIKGARRRMKERMKRMEENQVEILRTLQEIRDQLKAKNDGAR